MAKAGGKNNKLDILVSTKIYSLDSIITAAYTFIDRAYILLDYEKNGDIKITFKARDRVSAGKFRELSGEFENELLHQSLRVRLAKSNKKIREMIIGQALFTIEPGKEEELEIEEELEQELKDILADTDDEGDHDYLEDPLGIAVPWEEKHKKKNG